MKSPEKVQCPSTLVKCVGVQWCGIWRDIPSKVKNKLFYLTSPPTKKEAHLVSLFGVWRQHSPHLGVILKPICQVTHKAASFVWGLEQKKALQWVQATMQVGLPFADIVVFEVSVADMDAF